MRKQRFYSNLLLLLLTVFGGVRGLILSLEANHANLIAASITLLVLSSLFYRAVTK